MWRLFTGSRCWRHASPCWEFWPSLTVFMHTCHQIISKLHKFQRRLNLCKNFTADLTNYSCQNALRNIVFPWYYYTRKGNITTRRISMTLEVGVISHNRLRAPIKFTSKHIPNTIWALQFFIQHTHHRYWSLAFSLNYSALCISNQYSNRVEVNQNLSIQSSHPIILFEETISSSAA